MRIISTRRFNCCPSRVSLLAIGFYILFATQELGLPSGYVGAFTTVLTVGTAPRGLYSMAMRGVRAPMLTADST